MLLSIFSFIVYSCNTKEPITLPVDPPVTEFATETIRDLAFTTGFSLTPKLPSEMATVGYVDTLYFKSITGNPLWHLAQWNTNVDLKGAALQTAADGSLYFGNIAKKIALYPDSSLVLELNASAEYAHPRLDGEPWVHLLIEQSFSFAPFVNTAKRIDFSVQLMLLKCDNKMAPGTFNPSLHTAQSPMYFVVRGKGNDGYIWFGIPSFDYRDVVLSDQPATMWDTGTQTYIANIAPSTVWGSTKFKVNEWRSGKIDLKPQIIAAFNAVKALGKFPNTTVDDLKITGMNFGWEIPGTFDAAIKIKKLSLKIVK
jgi:hypothetical protein